MNCLRCGMSNLDNAMYCSGCGNPISTNQINGQESGSITIIRPKNFFGCLVAYDVFVDNYYLGQVKNGETKQFLLYYGNHNIVIKHGINSGSQLITISNAQRNLVFECPIQMGIVTSKILFRLVNFYN